MVDKRKETEKGAFFRLKDLFLEHKLYGVIFFLLFVVMLGMSFFNECVVTRQNIKHLAKEDSRGDADSLATRHVSAETEGFLTVWFNRNDPSIEFWKKFDLPKQLNSPIYIGNCPNDPCISLSIDRITLPPEEPAAHISFGAISGRLRAIPRGFGFNIRLRKGCGAYIRLHEYDFAIEIVDDRVTCLTAVIAFFPGTANEGHCFIDSIGCK